MYLKSGQDDHIKIGNRIFDGKLCSFNFPIHCAKCIDKSKVLDMTIELHCVHYGYKIRVSGFPSHLLLVLVALPVVTKYLDKDHGMMEY